MSSHARPFPLVLPLLALALAACEASAPDAGEAAAPSQELRAWESNVELRSVDAFEVRGEHMLGCWSDGRDAHKWTDIFDCTQIDEYDPLDAQTNLERYILLEHDTDGFVPLQRMKTKFAVDDDTAPLVAITFSAMAWVSEQSAGPHTRLQILVDGQVVADPGPVTFWSSRPDPSRWSPTAFTFLVEAEPGIHTVEVQYETVGAHIVMRDASLRVDVERYVDAEVAGMPPVPTGLYGSASTPNTTTLLPRNWQALPGGGLDFDSGEDDDVMLMLSPTFSSSGGRFGIRAVVDGSAAYPTEVSFDADQELAARGLVFTIPGVGAGNHHVAWEWYSIESYDPTTVSLEALSQVAVVGPTSDPDYEVHTLAQELQLQLDEDDNANPDPYKIIPGLEVEVDLDEVSDVAITWTASHWGERVVFIAPVLNGEVLRDKEILLTYEAALDEGPRTYTFGLADVPADSSTVIGLAVRSAGDPNGTSYLSSATAGVFIKRRIGPSLAVGAKLGHFSREREAIVEPVVGPRKILAIAIDTGRDDAVITDPGLFEDYLEQALFGADPSAANYLTAMSGGRASLVEVAAPKLHEVDPADQGGDETSNVFWSDIGCSGEWHGSNTRRWATALLLADADIDFSDYDADKDGVVEAHELGIIIYSVDDGIGGSTTEHHFRPYCDPEKKFELDGVEIREFSQISVPAISDISQAELVEAAAVSMHELGHLLLGLDDQYYPFEGLFDATTGAFTPKCSDANCMVEICLSEDEDPQGSSLPQCELREMNTDPYRVGLMSRQNELGHLTGFEKLQLGWVRPRIAMSDGFVSLTDIAVSEDLLILPRRYTDAKEHFTIEARFASGPVMTSKYDWLIGDDGLAVFHIIEPAGGCLTGDPTQCLPLTAVPQCVPQDMWDTFADNYSRAGIRFLQNDLTHWGDKNNSLWTSSDMTDEAAGGGLSCPSPMQIGVKGGESHLVWSDLSPSGYQALGITTSDPTVDFDIVVP